MVAHAQSLLAKCCEKIPYEHSNEQINAEPHL